MSGIILDRDYFQGIFLEIIEIIFDSVSFLIHSNSYIVYCYNNILSFCIYSYFIETLPIINVILYQIFLLNLQWDSRILDYFKDLHTARYLIISSI